MSPGPAFLVVFLQQRREETKVQHCLFNKKDEKYKLNPCTCLYVSMHGWFSGSVTVILLDLIRSFDVSFRTDEVTNIQIFSRVRIRPLCGHMMACHNIANQTSLPSLCERKYNFNGLILSLISKYGILFRNKTYSRSRCIQMVYRKISKVT